MENSMNNLVLEHDKTIVKEVRKLTNYRDFEKSTTAKTLQNEDVASYKDKLFVFSVSFFGFAVFLYFFLNLFMQ